ncbi:MAG: GNAT family N-acetyltransferase [Chitinophagaceae bacterium]
MNAIEIRYATETDAGLIADMSRHTFLTTFGPQNSQADIDTYMNVQFTREALMAEVGAAGNIFLLACIGDVPAGYVRLKENSFEGGLKAVKPIEIARFYAMPAMIGKGIGKAMMQYCIEMAELLQFDVIWLGVWERNVRAIDFYTAFGFKKFGEHGFLVGNDLQNDYLMSRNL